MIPLWFWPALCIALLVLVAWSQTRRITRAVNNSRAIEAERIARANAAPLGNVDRYWGAP